MTSTAPLASTGSVANRHPLATNPIGEPSVSSCAGDVTNLVVQVRGEGGPSKCDVIFQMDLANAEAGGDAIRESWVRRQMYSLIGEYPRFNNSLLIRGFMLQLRAWKREHPAIWRPHF